MQPELFQNFIDSISTLTREQLGILDSSLPSIRIKIEEVSVDSESETAPSCNRVPATFFGMEERPDWGCKANYWPFD